MPSGKEIEEASLYFSESTNPELCMIRYGKIMLDAYLSMKSERDKYKAIVEADTKALKLMIQMHDDLFAQCLSNPIKNAWGKDIDCILVNDAYTKANDALALREKES
jgi:hypothetical protein